MEGLGQWLYHLLQRTTFPEFLSAPEHFYNAWRCVCLSCTCPLLLSSTTHSVYKGHMTLTQQTSTRVWSAQKADFLLPQGEKNDSWKTEVMGAWNFQQAVCAQFVALEHCCCKISGTQSNPSNWLTVSALVLHFQLRIQHCTHIHTHKLHSQAVSQSQLYHVLY